MNFSVAGMYPYDISAELVETGNQSLHDNDKISIRHTMIKGRINNYPGNILIDSGAQISLINEKYLNKIKGKSVPILPSKNISITTANNSQYKVQSQAYINISMQKMEFTACVFVVKDLIYDVVLGIDTLTNIKAIINLEEQTLTCKIDNGINIIHFNQINEHNNIGHDNNLNDDKFISKPVIKLHVPDQHILEENTHDQIKINSLLKQYSKLFSNKPLVTNVYTHRIDVRDENKFIRKTYPIPLHYKSKVDSEIRQMVENQIIERSNSDFLNPMVVVKKKNGDIRVCLDMRNLNTITKKSYDCAPNMEGLFNKCQGVRCMTRLDLKSGFWQIPLDKESRKYTAFLYDNKCYQFKVVPFGLVTSLAAMVRCLEHALGPEVEEFVNIFVDDILVMSKTLDEHIQHLRIVFDKLQQANLTLNQEKCEFGKSQIKFLGHIISAEGMTTDPEKIESITGFPAPRKIKDLRAFLGLTGYYRRFIPEYAKTIEPLLELLRKNTKWRWTENHDRVMDDIKKLFLKNVHVYHPTKEGKYVLNCDASDYAIGGVLYQIDSNGEHRIIGHANRSLKGAERNYFTSEKEILAIVYCLNKFRGYLVGQHFEILSDNQALSFLLKCKLTNARMSRWIIAIQEYDFSIKYCKASDNKTADILSRYPPVVEERMVSKNQGIQILAVKYKFPDDITNKIKNIHTYQKQDDIVKKLRQNLQVEPKNNYIVVKDVLYKLIDGKWKVVMPECMIDTLVEAAHLSLGHAGPYKCYLALREDFIWNNMARRIKNVLKYCYECQTAKYPNYHTCVEMGNIISGSKGKLLCVDFVGVLPRAGRGLRNLVVCTDAFTKHVSLYAIGRQTTDAVLNVILNKYIPKYGNVEKILTDQGKQFQNRRWHEELEKHNIQAILTSIRRPQGNLAERVNKEVGRLFRTYCHLEHSKWPEYLEFFEYVINNCYNDTTGYTPCELHTDTITSRPWSKYVNKIPTQNMEVSKEIKQKVAQKRIEDVATKKTTKYNAEHRLTKFKVGEKVLIKALNVGSTVENRSAKFLRLFNGPFVLSDQVGKNTFLVKNPDRNKIIGKYHASSLRKFYEKVLM